jgi:small-conductance mechanosensitive channel
VLGFGQDVLDLAELPTVDGALSLDLHFGLQELLLPFV